MSINLVRAFRAEPSACIAFVGAGGKTTAMFQLARQLPAPVIVTATSHLGLWQLRFADQHITAETLAPLEEIKPALRGVILITGSIDRERTRPIDEPVLNWLRQFCNHHSIPLLVEADGARQKPLKGWAEHEPPIPPFVEQVIQVAGLSSVGRSLNEENVHRPDVFSRLSGLNIGELITAEALVRALVHTEGGVKNIPCGARRVVLLNHADTPELQATAHEMTRSLLSTFDSVIISSLQQEKIFAVHEPIAGIILAAGEAARFGQSKQLLDWRGQPFVRAVAKIALDSGLSPVVVVTGANAESVEEAVKGLDVKVVRNAEWKTGQASSIKAGVLRGGVHRSGNAGGAVFLLADQPQVTASVIRALVEKHAEGLYPIVAPLVIDRRANPVLFDRATFSDLITLEGDVGGRAIFHKYRVEYLPWHDERLLLDVDTPEHYRRLIADDAL